jgi:hypothetical protein
VRIPEPKRKVAWRRQEEALHQEGVKKVPGSGSGTEKGDNKGVEFLVQCKTTYKQKRTISEAEWVKTRQDARKEDRLPVMQMQLENTTKLAVLDWDDFVAIVEQAGMEI